MVFILETSDKQAVKAIMELAAKLKIQIRMREHSELKSEANSPEGPEDKWFDMAKLSTKHFKFNREEINAR